MELTERKGRFVVEYTMLDENLISIDPNVMLRTISDKDVRYEIVKDKQLTARELLEKIKNSKVNLNERIEMVGAIAEIKRALNRKDITIDEIIKAVKDGD